MRPSTPTLLCAFGVTVAGCAFAEAAGEILIGDEYIDAFDQVTVVPSVDELAGLDEEDIKGIVGFPGTLASGTLAHLKGAMDAAGECHRSLEQEDTADGVLGVDVAVTSCNDSGSCSERCGDFRGIRIVSDVEVQLLDEETAQEVKDIARGVSPDIIVQFRLQIMELRLFQTNTDGGRVTGNDLLSRFELRGHTDGGDDLVILTLEDLDRIETRRLERETTPKGDDRPRGARFDVDVDSPFVQKISQSTVDGEPIAVSMTLELEIPRASLYELQLEGAGIALHVQPELMFSVAQLFL